MKFRIYMNNALEGPFEVSELCELPGFGLSTSVCPDGECDWQPAAAYPLITRQMEKRLVSGDYSSEGIASFRLPEVASQNWRAAIIPAHIPDRSSSNSAIMTAPRTVSVSGSTASRSGGSKPGVFDSLQKWLLRERKRVLFLILSVTAVATCMPQRDNVRMIIDVFTNPDSSAMPLPRHRAKKNAPHTGGFWKWIKASRAAAASATRPTPSKPSEEITEIGSEELGDGTIKKVVVITREIDGTKLSTTKTYVVSAHKARSRKH